MKWHGIKKKVSELKDEPFTCDSLFGGCGFWGDCPKKDCKHYEENQKLYKERLEKEGSK
jgi:hypothetical protein